MLYTSISLDNTKILGEFVADSYFFEPDLYNYAFRLIKVSDNGSKLEVFKKGYSDNRKVDFNKESLSGVFFIRCYLQDKKNMDVRAFDSNLLNI